MKRVEEQDIQSQDSGDLRQDELININKHFKNRRTNRSNKMTAQMETMYKDALMNVIFGQFEEASKKLKNLIALYPDNPDAFHLLGTMHEQLGQIDKAVQYFFMSTYLSPPNIQKWIKVADMSMLSKMYTQAAYCYGRALKIENYNIQLMTKRAEAFQLSYQIKKAISTYKKILSISYSLTVVKSFAKLKFRRGEYSSARQILKTYPNYILDANLVYMVCQTYLKQKKYENILNQIGMHIAKLQNKQRGRDLKQQPLQFVKVVYISCIMLKLKTFQNFDNDVESMKSILLQNYDEQLSQLYQDIIYHLNQERDIRYFFTELLIKHRPHQTIQNYLFISQFFKFKSQYHKAIQYLKEGLKIHSNSAQLSSQLNHLQVISGKCNKVKQNRKTASNNHSLKKKMCQDDQIYYSQSQLEQDNFQEIDKKQIKLTKFQEKQKRANNGKKQEKLKQMETDNPQVIRQLLQNSNSTLQQILLKSFSLKDQIAYNNKQVENCLQFIISITQNCKPKNRQQNQGLFPRVQSRRRYFSSKKNTKLSLIEANIQIILKILSNCILYFHKLLQIGQYIKIKLLCQLLAKGYFFKWQNKNAALKEYKTLIYEIGLLVCLNLNKLQSASYFIRFLANKYPENQLYLLIVNYLIHNSENKQCINSLLAKHLSKPFKSSNGDLQLKNKQSQKFFDDQQDQQNANMCEQSIKMQKKENQFVNVNLNYLFGIQYMQTGCFELAISSFLKIINLISLSMKKTVWLCLTSCLLQLSSSRNTHTKLPFTNRSSYCLLQYLHAAKDIHQARYNKARWFSQIKLNDKAIQEYNQLLANSQTCAFIKDRCALNLLSIYKQMQNWIMVQKISKQYFCAEQFVNNKLHYQNSLESQKEIQQIN